MGFYLNQGNDTFRESVSREIYVDKTMLIKQTNYAMDKGNKYICVSRPRRFGKSTDANMLVAYYSKGCDSSELFAPFKIAECEHFHKYLNQCNVFHFDIQQLLTMNESVEKMISFMEVFMNKELQESYAEYVEYEQVTLNLMNIFQHTNEKFVFVLDEWDCIFRKKTENINSRQRYIDFLNLLFKGQTYVSLVYMTGILPVRKYGTESVLNMFDEISMIHATPYEPFMGFTEQEVVQLCKTYQMDFEQIKTWYNGYHLNDEICIYSPRSVVCAIEKRKIQNYWTSTETFESLRNYIEMNFDHLKESMIKMLSGEHVMIDTSSFENDMSTFYSKDDVLTLLVHLGYLAYHENKNEVSIPNKEVMDSFVTSIKNASWQATTKALQNSMALLKATQHMHEELVAGYIEQAHLETSILQYNDENALSYTLSLAYYVARNDYTIIRELPTGKGFADLVFIPKADQMAMIIELKVDDTVDTAISQIKNKQYYFGLEHYLDRLLLVAVTYDKKTKTHNCKIEMYQR